MLKEFFKKASPSALCIVVAAGILLIVFCALLARNIQMAKQSGIFAQQASISELLLKNKQANWTSVSDIQYIDAWMTFAYVNFIFDIPESYLKDWLRIDDKNYPNLIIRRYAKSRKLDKAGLVNEIKKLVREYMDSRPGK